MKEKVTFFIKKTIAFFIAVFSLLTLAFVFIGVEATGTNLNYSVYINGFHLLPGMDVSSITLLDGYGHYMLFILICSIILIVLSILNFFLKEHKLGTIISIVGFVLTLFYMCSAISELVPILKSLGGYNQTNVNTASLIPVIIQALLIIIYFVIDLVKFKEIFIIKPKNKKLDYVDELKKLKELLDAEIITQEEFELKKKDIMGL